MDFGSISQAWDYEISELDVSRPEDAREALRDLGALGWELVCIAPPGAGGPRCLAVFKRPMEG